MFIANSVDKSANLFSAIVSSFIAVNEIVLCTVKSSLRSDEIFS